jgi:hypothetical protein
VLDPDSVITCEWLMGDPWDPIVTPAASSARIVRVTRRWAAFMKDRGIRAGGDEERRGS